MSRRLLTLLPILGLLAVGCFEKESDDDDDDDDGATTGAPDNWGDGGSGDGSSGDGGSGDGGSGDGGSGDGGSGDGGSTDGSDGSGDGSDGSGDGSDGSSETTTGGGAGRSVEGQMVLRERGGSGSWTFDIAGETTVCSGCDFSFEATFSNPDFGDYAWELIFEPGAGSTSYVYLMGEYYWGVGRAGDDYAFWTPGEDYDPEYSYYTYEGLVYMEGR